MNSFKFQLATVALALQLFSSLHAQTDDMLPRSTPEAEGVSSADILKFVEATASGKTEFHSFMLLRHGKVIAEGWWAPYRQDLRHTLYSCSKSFTATAVGFAVSEKKLALEDKVTSFFPGEVPDTVSKFLAELTVKDALIMSDGMAPDPSFAVASKDSDWIKGFLATPILHEPGSVFLYNSLGTYMLSAIVQKVTGQKILDYLKPRLFDPLGIRGMDWETDVQGINTGGWGLRVRTADMAKFAQLFLQKGKWNGKQLLPAGWVEEASTMKILQDPSASQSHRDSSDWLQGYCYQMWRCRHNAFRGDGAFGQFMIVMPDQDAALAITAETADMQEEINLVWKYLLPAFKSDKLPSDPSANTKLKEMLRSLSLTAPEKSASPSGSSFDGKTFNMQTNSLGIKSISFNFSGQICTVKFQNDQHNYSIKFREAGWQSGETNMPGPSLTAGAIENTSMLYPAKIEAGYSWKDPNTLQLALRYIESPHWETFICHFNDNRLTLDVSKSFDFGSKTLSIQSE